jgi:hypothetical protein
MFISVLAYLQVQRFFHVPIQICSKLVHLTSEIFISDIILFSTIIST